MTFQAYLNAIKEKTGRTPEELKADADGAGIFTPSMKATELIGWLKDIHDLGRGHSMAVWAVWKAKGWVK